MVGVRTTLRFVYAVYVTEGRCDSEAWADFAQLGVSVINVFWLSVQCRSVHVAVVHTVFFTAGATQFDFRVMPILDIRAGA